MGKIDDEDKDKKYCFNKATQLLRTVRKTGITVCIGIQRPDVSQMSATAKNLCTTKLGLKQENTASALVACDTHELANVDE